jgi:hypothetical protein
MTTEQTDRPWSVALAVEEISEEGKHVELSADKATCEAIARVVGVRNVLELSATFDLMRHGNGVHITGQVNAKVGQTCVVTLDPIESDIEETVDVEFQPAPDEVSGNDETAKKAKADDPPEPLVGGVIDLGHVATEFLMLAIDPYPRKPGAKFVPPKTADEDAHPFAALEALKKRTKSDPT